MGRWSFTGGIVLAVCVAVSIPAAAIAADDAARAAAEEWLRLKDAGDHEACWNRSARFYREKMTKDQVSKAQWKEGSARVQLYLGRTLSRKVRSDSRSPARQARAGDVRHGVRAHRCYGRNGGLDARGRRLASHGRELSTVAIPA